jgi:uncharacterized protein
MKCPVCKTPDLLMSERQGIEIDYCAACRGVWLDRGELDKLAVRANEESVETARDRQRDDYKYDGDRQQGGHSYGDYRHGPGPYKKKKSLFGELFDFG